MVFQKWSLLLVHSALHLSVRNRARSTVIYGKITTRGRRHVMLSILLNDLKYNTLNVEFLGSYIFKQHTMSQEADCGCVYTHCRFRHNMGLSSQFLSNSGKDKCGNLLVTVLYERMLFPHFQKPPINHLKTKGRPLYLKTQSVPRSKHFSSRL